MRQDLHARRRDAAVIPLHRPVMLDVRLELRRRVITHVTRARRIRERRAQHAASGRSLATNHPLRSLSHFFNTTRSAGVIMPNVTPPTMTRRVLVPILVLCRALVGATAPHPARAGASVLQPFPKEP